MGVHAKKTACKCLPLQDSFKSVQYIPRVFTQGEIHDVCVRGSARPINTPMKWTPLDLICKERIDDRVSRDPWSRKALVPVLLHLAEEKRRTLALCRPRNFPALSTWLSATSPLFQATAFAFRSFPLLLRPPSHAASAQAHALLDHLREILT